MARYTEPTAEQTKAWNDWLAERPENIQALAKRFDPWTLYLLKPTQQRVTVAAFNEDNTLIVNVLGKFNEALLHERAVFGINPDDLEETDLPAQPGVVLLTPEQFEENIDVLRVTIRPDLFTLDANGKAQRKH